MDLLQLKYFQTVAELEHITKASEKLHVSQPSLSKTISRLEDSLGVQLFDRTGRHIKLNRFGKAYLKHVDRIFHELEDGQKELDDMVGTKKGEVRIGTTTTRLIPTYIGEFLQENPHISVRILQVSSQDIHPLLEEGKIDFCISPYSQQHPNIEHKVLLSEEICLAVPPDHIFRDKTQIMLSEMKSERFISLTADYSFRETTIEYCEQAGFTPNITYECNDAEVIFDMVRMGLGCAFIPDHWWKKSQLESLAKVKILEPSCKRHIELIWMRDRYLSKAALLFQEFIEDCFLKKNKVKILPQ